MFGLLADVSLSIPDPTSPWFFWYIPFGLAVLSFIGQRQENPFPCGRG